MHLEDEMACLGGLLLGLLASNESHSFPLLAQPALRTSSSFHRSTRAPSSSYTHNREYGEYRQRYQFTFLGLSKEEESNESEIDSATYYSPNTPIDESSYRYDLQEEDGNDNTDATASTIDDKELTFFDEATIFVRAGSGGHGSSTYKIIKKHFDLIPNGLEVLVATSSWSQTTPSTLRQE